MQEPGTPTSPVDARPGSPGVPVALAMPSPTRPGPAATDARLVEAVELVTGGDVSVLSLDVFDTLLWRKVPEPMAAFALLGARLHDTGVLARDLDIGGFAELRSRAESAARSSARPVAGAWR